MRTLSSQSLNGKILKILATGAALFIIVAAPNAAGFLIQGLDKTWDQRRTKQAFSRLRKRGLIDFSHDKSGALRVVLTAKGKKEVAMFQSGEVKIRKKKWDGFWYVIFFDIPERQKKAREALRQKFRAWGLYPLQRSVYVSLYPCEEEIQLLKELFEIHDQSIIVLKTKTLPYTKDLRKYFVANFG